MRSALDKKVGGVYDSPKLRAARITIAINPGFLKGNYVPIFGVGCVEDVVLSCFWICVRFAAIFLASAVVWGVVYSLGGWVMWLGEARVIR